ncbi:MAG: S1C family serine protease [Candidatus Zixiibacteriota bacterium]
MGERLLDNRKTAGSPLRPWRITAAAVIAGAIWLAGHGTMARADSTDTSPFSILRALESEMRSIVESVAPSVVTIRATHSASGEFPVGIDRSMSVGSGVFLDSTGLIMTSSGVVSGADDFWIETYDGRLYQGILLGASDEIALLQIKGCRIVPAHFGDALDLGVGSMVAAVGNSYGYACGVSWGEVNGFRPDGTIQMTLGISAGSSGGAVVNTAGRIVGLVRAKISEPFYLDPVYCQTGKDKTPISLPGRRLELPTSAVSLAIPIQSALRSAHRILEAGTEPRAYLGVYVDDLRGWYAAHFKTSEGVLVTGVVGQTPAEAAGLRQGDLITAIDHQPVGSMLRFRQVVAQTSPGQRLQFDVVRSGQSLKIVVEAGRADAPHLAATDRKSRPFPVSPAASVYSESKATPVSAEEVVPARRQTVAAKTGQHQPGGASEDWVARLNAMQCIIDSLRQELLILQTQAPR